MEPGREVARRAIRRVHGWRQDYHFERTYLAFRSWFRFRSRSERWCAIEPRREGLGGGVRSQDGAQGEKGASNTLSAADAGNRRHIVSSVSSRCWKRPCCPRKGSVIELGNIGTW